MCIKIKYTHVLRMQGKRPVLHLKNIYFWASSYVVKCWARQLVGSSRMNNSSVDVLGLLITLSLG